MAVLLGFVLCRGRGGLLLALLAALLALLQRDTLELEGVLQGELLFLLAIFGRLALGFGRLALCSWSRLYGIPSTCLALFGRLGCSVSVCGTCIPVRLGRDISIGFDMSILL